LIRRAASGDAAARQLLLDVYREHLRRMIAVRLDERVAPRVDASDVVQETLLEASRRLDRYFVERPLPFLPWLRQIAGERVVDLHRRHLKSQRRSVLREQGPVEPGDGSARALAGWMMASTPSPSEEALRRERLEQLKSALDALAPRHREILVMRHLEHLKIESIAELLEITPGAVKARLLRALLKLRNLIDPDL
jgi:RNA polymerase sigma-70 factor (ECF subfamily)